MAVAGDDYDCDVPFVYKMHDYFSPGYPERLATEGRGYHCARKFLFVLLHIPERQLPFRLALFLIGGILSGSVAIFFFLSKWL